MNNLIKNIEINKYSREERINLLKEIIEYKIDVEEYEDIPYVQNLLKDMKGIRFMDEDQMIKTNTKFSILVFKYIKDLVKQEKDNKKC